MSSTATSRICKKLPRGYHVPFSAGRPTPSHVGRQLWKRKSLLEGKGGGEPHLVDFLFQTSEAMKGLLPQRSKGDRIFWFPEKMLGPKKRIGWSQAGSHSGEILLGLFPFLSFSRGKKRVGESNPMQ